jgi:hypothetical protein
VDFRRQSASTAAVRSVFAVFLPAAAMLMCTHDRCVDHGIFIVGVSPQMIENPGRNAGFGPAAEAQVHDAEIAEAFGSIAPRVCPCNICTAPPRQRPIALGRFADGSFAPRMKIPDVRPLFIAQRMTTRPSVGPSDSSDRL